MIRAFIINNSPAAAAAAAFTAGRQFNFPHALHNKLHLVHQINTNRSALRLENGEDDDINIDIRLKEKNHGRESSFAYIISLYVTSIFSLISSVGTLWSEYSVITTGCGPFQLSDSLERSCYLGTLVVAGLSVFARIVTRKSMSDFISHFVNGDKRIGDDMPFSLGLIQIAENVSLFAVLMAFISLGVQEYKGERMDGLSGINIDMCRATQQLH